MKIIIELNSLEEGAEVIDAVRWYRGEVLGITEAETGAEQPAEDPKKEEPMPEKAEAPAEEPAPENEKPFPDLSEVRKRVKALQEKVGKEATKSLLKEFGATGASSVDEEVREAFIARAEEVLNG